MFQLPTVTRIYLTTVWFQKKSCLGTKLTKTGKPLWKRSLRWSRKCSNARSRTSLN